MLTKLAAFYGQYKNWISLAFVYFSLTLIFTYPLVTRFTTDIAGVDEDSPVHVWHYWWFYYSLFVLKLNPFFTDYIFYPQVINRTFDIHAFINSFLSLPLQFLFSLITASNIVFIFTLVMNALSAAVLTNYLTKSLKASFLSGVIFGFFPYLFAQASDGHTNLISLWFIPLFLYFLLRTLSEKSEKNAVLAGLTLGALGLNDLSNTAFTLILLGLVIFYYFVFYRQDWLNPAGLKRLVILGVVFILVFLPMMLHAVYSMFKGFKPGVPLWVQSFWSARLEMFFHPSSMSTFLKRYADPTMLNPVESTLYIGMTILALLLISIYFFFKLPKNSKIRLGLFYFLAFSFFILSLGPFLYWNRVKTNIPLPFAAFHLVPLIGGVQEPVRIHPYTMLSLAVISGFTFRFLEEKVKKYSLALLVVLTGLILFEYLPIPFPTTEVKVHPVYQQIAKQQEAYAILDLPMGWNTGQYALGLSPVGTIQLYQAYHHKKIFRGTVARLPVENINYYSKVPGIHYLADPTKEPLPIDTDASSVRETFKKLNVRYILIHKELFRKGKARLTDLTLQIISDFLKAEKIIDDEQLTVYRLDLRN